MFRTCSVLHGSDHKFRQDEYYVSVVLFVADTLIDSHIDHDNASYFLLHSTINLVMLKVSFIFAR